MGILRRGQMYYNNCILCIGSPLLVKWATEFNSRVETSEIAKRESLTSESKTFIFYIQRGIVQLSEYNLKSKDSNYLYSQVRCGTLSTAGWHEVETSR
jgi:hypothetical protein